MMPGFSGYQVCEHLRRRFALKDLPVIFLTARNQVTDLVAAFQAGGNDFLAKPVAREELLSRVRTHLQLLDINRNLERLVTDRTRELNASREQILSSINYARRIQKAILAEPEELRATLPDSFILSKPKDIVSGDFFWFRVRPGMIFLAAVDCTGHGVPGAFMSMIGNSLLNQIVIRDQVYEPADILARLHEAVVNSLKQEGHVVHATDGMDLSLCRIDPVSHRLTFSGAQRPLYLIRKTAGGSPELITIKGDRKSIGGRRHHRQPEFRRHVIELQRGDCFYFITDGFTDQPNPERKCYGSPRFRQFLTSIAHLSMTDQHAAFEQELAAYRGGAPQRDDITVVGVRY